MKAHVFPIVIFFSIASILLKDDATQMGFFVRSHVCGERIIAYDDG
jgi:hypothetical protein